MIVVSLPDRELAGILEELAMDDTVDLLEELPAGVVKRVLKNARPETRRLINQFLKYPEQSVGSIMTAEFIDLKGTMTAAGGHPPDPPPGETANPSTPAMSPTATGCWTV